MMVSELKQAYLEYFRKREHRVFPSDSLIPHDDPSLLFTGAGMNQFKPYFLGLKKDLKRAASCQKCLRTADLERVGKTDYHHSFFEMLGNFSFGDYFKKEAIVWGWEFVTKVLKIPEKKLWVSVYQEDPDAFAIWKKEVGLPDSKIVKMGPEDNFWPANAPKDGPNGPCGPCSEIYVGEVPGKGVEIWNLVFTSFDRQSDGSLVPLPQKNIDTGMGLERTASILQSVKSNFEIDSFAAFRKELKALLKKGSNETTHENAVMDHARAAVFCVADGALPSNEGRGYVVRKLIRLACDHLTAAGAEAGHFKDTVGMVARMMGGAYPGLKEKDITLVVANEETAYAEARRRAASATRGTLSVVDFSFMLYDAYGLPIDAIRERFSEEGLVFDDKGFQALLGEQKKRSRASSKVGGEIFKKSDLYALTEGLPATRFTGYSGTEGKGKLLRISKGDVLIFDQTPFYAEAGGQVGDRGVISGGGFEAEVLDTQAHEKIVLHHVRVKKGSPEEGKSYDLQVDAERRSDIMNNHTGTHLLHAALRKVLGEHVKQSGSLVAPDYLRFDFGHFKGLTPEELLKVETMVNDEIQKNTPLKKEEMSREEAAGSGAIAFFGEKYGERVRVVSVGDFSKEFCGGTHLKSTGQIGRFKIVSESSIQAGVRRIEAVTGRWALKRAQESAGELADLAKAFGVTTEGLAQVLPSLRQRTTSLKQKLSAAAQSKVNAHEKEKFDKAPTVRGVKVVTDVVRHNVSDLTQEAARFLQKQGAECISVLAAAGPDSVSFTVSGTTVLISKGFNSGEVIRVMTPIVGGKGGGRPDFAVGGGKEVDKLNQAMTTAEKWVEEFIKTKL